MSDAIRPAKMLRRVAASIMAAKMYPPTERDAADLIELANVLEKITPKMIASARGATQFSQADRPADQFEHLESAAEVLETLMGKPR